MNISKRDLYAFGEPLGECVTRKEAGRLICGGGGGGGQSTTVQSIPDELKPLANAYTQTAIGLNNTPYEAYGGQRYADLNGVQMAALNKTADRAMQGSETINNAEAALNQNIQGGQTNPYLDQMVGKAQDSVRSQFNTGAVNSGSFGNAGLQQQFQEGLGDVATQMYGQAYDADKQRQMQSIGMAQQFGNQAYDDAGKLMAAGQTLQDQQQQNLDFQYQQDQARKDDPYKKLAGMSGVFGSNLGQSASTTQSGGGK